MNVLLLGVEPFPLAEIIRGSGCTVVKCHERISVDDLISQAIDFAVSYRYPHIVRRPIIEHLNGRIINLHISLLPWNRGADPNLWSFLENTPKGITIHYIDPGLDTGDIIIQKEIIFDESQETLSSSYETLNREIIHLFAESWPLIMQGAAPRQAQSPGGNGHKLIDKEPYSHLWQEKGWDTPVSSLAGKAISGDRA